MGARASVGEFEDLGREVRRPELALKGFRYPKGARPLPIDEIGEIGVGPASSLLDGPAPGMGIAEEDLVRALAAHDPPVDRRLESERKPERHAAKIRGLARGFGPPPFVRARQLERR